MTAKIGNLKNPVRSSWIRDLGCRLDAPPFVSGALEARKKIESLRLPKNRVAELVRPGPQGVFHAGRVTRLWVSDPLYGTKFLSGSDIFESDLSNLSLIANRVVRSNGKLLVRAGWILITRSGTVGRTVYARPDMDGFALTEDVLRVVPDTKKIDPGYLFAFLASKFGLPVVASGTYGSIIQHLEAEHILPILVPRFGAKLEQKVDHLVQVAAEQRAEASKVREHVRAEVERFLGWDRSSDASVTSVVRSHQVRRRMDGFYHSTRIQLARKFLANRKESKLLGSCVEEVFEPNRGARRKVEDDRFGLPFLSSSSVFQIDPKAEYSVSKRTPNLERLVLTDRDLLLPRSGQVGGIIGRAVLPLPNSYGSAASEHLVRVRCFSRSDAFFLWGILTTEPGYLASVSTAFGTSIPSLDCSLLAETSVPWILGSFRDNVIAAATKITCALNDAIQAERKAVEIVEQAIEENA